MKKKTISINYPVIANFGDLLNEDIIQELFMCKVTKKGALSADLSAIGSSLAECQYSSSLKLRIRQFVYGNILCPTIHVWGTGFISYEENPRTFFHRDTIFSAVRGELTKKRVEKMLGKKLDIPTGDGGLLSSLLLKTPIKKKYTVGVIAHFREQNEPYFQNLLDNYDNSIFIDVRKSPKEVISHIAECEVIISSSLHGLIVSDSLRIPNIHVKVSTNLIGDGYKFDDYYSGYGINHNFIVAKDNHIPSVEWIKTNYKITDKMVEQKQKQLIDAFPFK